MAACSFDGDIHVFDIRSQSYFSFYPALMEIVLLSPGQSALISLVSHSMSPILLLVLQMVMYGNLVMIEL